MFSSAGQEEMIYFYRAFPILDCLVCPLAPLVCQCPLSARSGRWQIRTALLRGRGSVLIKNIALVSIRLTYRHTASLQPGFKKLNALNLASKTD